MLEVVEGNPTPPLFLPRFLSAIVSLNDLEVLSRVLLRGQSTASCCEGSEEEGPAGKRVTPTNADMTEHSYWRGFCWSNHSSEPYLGLNLTAVCDKYPMTLGNLTENKQTKKPSHGWESSNANTPNTRHSPNHGLGMQWISKLLCFA